MDALIVVIAKGDQRPLLFGRVADLHRAGAHAPKPHGLEFAYHEALGITAILFAGTWWHTIAALLVDQIKDQGVDYVCVTDPPLSFRTADSQFGDDPDQRPLRGGLQHIVEFLTRSESTEVPEPERKAVVPTNWFRNEDE